MVPKRVGWHRNRSFFVRALYGRCPNSKNIFFSVTPHPPNLTKSICRNVSPFSLWIWFCETQNVLWCGCFYLFGVDCSNHLDKVGGPRPWVCFLVYLVAQHQNHYNAQAHAPKKAVVSSRNIPARRDKRVSPVHCGAHQRQTKGDRREEKESNILQTNLKFVFSPGEKHCSIPNSGGHRLYWKTTKQPLLTVNREIVTLCLKHVAKIYTQL